MPIFVKDFSWHETDRFVHIALQLKGTDPSKVSIMSTRRYLRVTYTPFIFEAFLRGETDDTKCVAKIGNGSIILTLQKLVAVLWHELSEKDIDKQSIFKKRAEAEDEVRQREEHTAVEKEARRAKQKTFSVEQQMELETVDRERIEALKNKEKLKMENELELWKEKQVGRKITEAKRDVKKAVAAKQEVRKKSSGVAQRPASQIKDFQKDESKIDDLPPPRQSASITVDFTPRVFPTAARESQAADEQEWLRKQAEFRRMKEHYLDKDLKPEEKDPVWLKDKGDYFFKLGNYHAAVNAYNQAILLNNKLPTVYSNRAACHLKLGNLHKVVEDSSSALQLYNPPVPSNAASRLKCHIRRGTAFCKLELYVEGLQDYETALKLDAENQQIQEDAEKIRQLIQNTHQVTT